MECVTQPVAVSSLGPGLRGRKMLLPSCFLWSRGPPGLVWRRHRCRRHGSSPPTRFRHVGPAVPSSGARDVFFFFVSLVVFSFFLQDAAIRPVPICSRLPEPHGVKTTVIIIRKFPPVQLLMSSGPWSAKWMTTLAFRIEEQFTVPVV